MSRAPLRGIRVLDLTKVLAGPLCTQSLADLGAEIVKVEPLGMGDETRHWPPQRGGDGAVFLSVNRNKRSLALDLKSADGLAVFKRLAAGCDVVVESFGTGVVERLGVEYDAVRLVQPDIVCCSISGFGRTGPLRDAPGYDVILQAYSGIMAMTGEAGSGPIRIPISPVDQTTGLHAYGAILAALFDRQNTGQGCRIEVSLYESVVALLSYSLQIYWEKGTLPEKNGLGHESLCSYQAFETADQPILLGIANDRLWAKFCQDAGLPDAAEDRFAIVTIEHRIHYDRAYATGVEGYPALVVNGGIPILALLELYRNQARREPDRIVLRNLAPLFCGGPIRLCANPSDTGWQLWAEDDGGRLAVEMTVT